MKQTNKILAILMAVLVFTFYARATVNITGGLLQTDLNAGGKNLTNVGGVFSPNGSPITGGGGPSAFATNANLPVNPISVSANYLIGAADESAMLTNKVLYMVSGTPTITVSNPPTAPVSFFVEEVGTSPISMATVSGVTFWKANGQTGIYTNASSITNYFSKTVQFTSINSTNWLISDPIPIQELLDRATTAAANVVAPFGSNIWYVAQEGSDSNTGKNTNAPLATVLKASLLATNYGNLIWQLDTDSNDLADAANIRLTNGVSFYANPGAVLWLTNYVGTITSGVNFRPYANCFIDNLTIQYLDGGTSSSGPIGWYGLAAPADGTYDSTNVIINNPTIYTQNQGFHIEKNANAHTLQWIINNPVIYASGNCYQQKAVSSGSFNVLINGGYFSTTNFVGANRNSKPIRVFSLGVGGNLTVNGGYYSYADSTNQTQGASTNGFFCYDEGGLVGVSFQNLTINNLNASNCTDSADFSDTVTPGGPQVGGAVLTGVVHANGSQLTCLTTANTGTRQAFYNPMPMVIATNGPTAGATNVLTTDGNGNWYFSNDKGLF